MPIVLTLLFLNFASGLNLYYAAQNLFSIPQQYMIAKRRLREAPTAGGGGARVIPPPPKPPPKT
jgi:membrane protein insertase Oxa1/YidC/SpoIIIJ